jgi:type IV secretory pathway VirB10-like protein
MFENLQTNFWSTVVAVNLAITGTPASADMDQSIDETLYADQSISPQSLQADTVAPQTSNEVAFTATAPPPPPPPAPKPAPAVKASPQAKAKASSKVSANPAPNAVPNPGSAQEIAFNMVTARGWGQSEFNCLVSLWNKESGWRVNAANPSGAYGIPQSMPGSKMASAGADWATNPATQITWGLNYITDRYKTPCGAWGKSQASGYY